MQQHLDEAFALAVRAQDVGADGQIVQTERVVSPLG